MSEDKKEHQLSSENDSLSKHLGKNYKQELQDQVEAMGLFSPLHNMPPDEYKEKIKEYLKNIL